MVVGQNVSQIQAVLARRVATIGELQEHLLRARWRRKGVAEWSVLGQGDRVSIKPTDCLYLINCQFFFSFRFKFFFSPLTVSTLERLFSFAYHTSRIIQLFQWATIAGRDGAIESRASSTTLDTGTSGKPSTLKRTQSLEILPHATVIGKKDNTHRQNRLNSVYYGHSSVFVKNIRGGQIFVNDPAVASWSVDAIRVIRDQLYRAGNGEIKLPFYENWPQEVEHFESLNGETNDGRKTNSFLPVWATERSPLSADNNSDETEVVITDLSAMASEVAELLNSMETQLAIQRRRRLSRLKPPRALVRSWYLFAAGIPALGYVTYKLFTGRLYIDISRHIILKVSSFYSEHVSDPIRSM